MRISGKTTQGWMAAVACSLSLWGEVHAEQGATLTNLLPNGSFEFWTHHGKESVQALSLPPQPQFDSDDPLIPVRWEWRMRKPAALSRTSEAHGGLRALRYSSPEQGPDGTLLLRYLELVPGAVYTYGVWIKGRGHVAVTVSGKALEGQQRLAGTQGRATNTWTHVGGQFTAPSHVRLVTLTLDCAGAADLFLDDAHISAWLDRPYDADAVLSCKAAVDADTLLFADFERDDPGIKFSGKAHLTADGAGRFGRALRLDKPDQAMISFVLPALPAEGTIECWLSPDAAPQLVKETALTHNLFLAINSSGQNLARLAAASDATLSWGWRIDGELYGKSQYLPTANAISLHRMRKGQWTHVAVSWDPAAWRIYVDGVLAGWKTDGPMTWWDAPVNLVSGPDWNGLIDEIRVSSVKRYGPIVPRGVTFLPLPSPVAVVAPPPPVAAPPVDAAAERAKLLGAIPATTTGVFESRTNATGEYVYEATTARPLVAGYDFTLETNRYVKGLCTALISSTRDHSGLPDNGGLYWKLGAIRPGPYWVGLVYHSDRAEAEATATAVHRMSFSAHSLYLNGRIIQCDKLGEPVQIAPGVWFAELQAQAAEVLKAGDEIAAVAPMRLPLRVARLILYPQAPPLGPFRWPINFGGHWSQLYTALGLNTEVRFLKAGGGSVDFADPWWGEEQKAESPGSLLPATGGCAYAQCVIANPLSVPVTVDYVCVIKGYYGQEAGRDAQRLTLAPHTRVVREVPFAVTPDDPGYFAEATVKAVDVPDLGWPEGDTVAYFPGYRQSVRWPDPFHYRDVRRLFFSGPVEDLHRTLLLDGLWNLAYTTNLTPSMPQPAELKVKPVQVPKSYGTDRLETMTPRPHSGYFSRTFSLPAGLAATGTVRLVVSDVKAEATAYVNGQRVGNVYGEETPLIADITRAIKPGTNELVLVVRDLIAIMNPAYVNPANPVAAAAYLDAPGLHGKHGLAVGSVTLEMSPSVAADDILVMTSVRQKTIGARLSVVNHQAASVRARVKATVLEARRPLFDLGEQTVDLAPDRPLNLAFERPWKNPRLWSPADPHLYVLAVEVTDVATGARLDLARARFGFRESWIVGPKLYFNGIPVKFKATTTPSTVGTRDDYQLSRGAAFPDYMDEFGYPCIEMITGVYNTPSRHNVEHDPFWANARSNLLVRARRSQNHPCIVAWDLSNEWLSFLPYAGGDMMLGAKRMRSLTDTILQQDPTRWTLYNSDGDLEGLLDNMSLHYMNPYYPDYAMRGHSSYFPDGAFWRELHQDFEPGKPIVATTHHPEFLLRPDEKVIMDTEYLWKVGGLMPPGLTRYVGEDDVLSPAIDSGAGPIAWYWKQCIDGHRDLGLTSVAIYGGITGAGRRGYQLQTFIMPDVVHHGFSGRTLRWKYSLMNDLFVPARFTFSWRLTAPDNRTVAKGRDVRKMSTGDLQRGELTLKLPKVSTRTKYTLHLRLESDGQFVNAEERDIDVFPDLPVAAGKLERKVLLFEGEGNRMSSAQHPATNIQRGAIQESTANALMAVGVTFESVADLSSLAARPTTRDPLPLLIIAEGALDTTNAAAVAGLDGFVAAGGRVLILAQTVTPEGLPVATKLERREWASQTFVRVPQHPVLAGVTDWDLHFWAPDRVVGQGAYTKPEGGASLTLVDSGAAVGQEWVQLMEVYRGKGRYLLCQLPLVANYSAEPMARELLARLVKYEAGPAVLTVPTGRLKAMVRRGSAIEQRLEALGAVYDVVQPDAVFGAGDVALVDAVIPVTDVQRAGWLTALAQGATVIVSGARPADIHWLSRLAGQSVSVTAPRYYMWGGRGYRVGSHPLTAGLSQVDLYWKRYEGPESAWAQAENPEYTIEPLQDWSVSAAGGRELIFPGALVVLPVGKGQLVMDQRRWFTSHEKLSAMANRNLSTLLLGAGVELAPVGRPRALPPVVAYEPIDLTPFATRALADDVAEDGVGGWSDQGPKGDLRSFSTGSQNLGGVPFAIGAAPRSCIVLSSKARPFPEKLPGEVTIPIGYPTEGFYFLHAAAYGGDYVALYQIQYADGTTADMPLMAGVNIQDWSGPGPFMREKGTQSIVAWTGSCPMFPLIGVYRMLWVNPKPALQVKAVRFANPALEAVPILLGLTAVVPKNGTSKAPDALIRAQALLADASRAVAAKDDAAAEKLLKEATVLEPSLTAAHQALADVHARKGDENAELATYQAWATAGAATPLPYNRIGEILERRKNYKGALDAYTKSLEIEWNQPPAIEAKARLEKRVSP